MTKATMTRREAVGSLAAGAGMLPVAAAARPAHQDTSLPVADRVEALLARMTLEEKVWQLVGVEAKAKLEDDRGIFDGKVAAANFPLGFGHLCSPSFSHVIRPGIDPSRNASQTAAYMNAVQRYHVEHTRLGIPTLAHEESLHGLARHEATSFPQAIGLASTWDPDLLRRVFAKAAAETRLRGVHMVLTPVLDVARDPRWGRVEETYGEDTYLCATMGLAAVQGFQGAEVSAGGDRLPRDRVLATCKHFAGHGAPEGGTNTAPLMMGERTMREELLPPYQVAVQQGHLRSVMTTYHEVDGVPMAANRWLMETVLRREWGFDGMVIADYGAITDLVKIHHVAANDADAAAMAILAGIDVELPNPVAYLALPQLVRSGRVPLARIDQAVRRVLAAKFVSGLMDDPYVRVAAADAGTGDKAGRALAREAASRSLILLKNAGDILPLDPAKLGTLAVLGHSAKDTPIGGYSDFPRQVVSVWEALQADAPGRFKLTYAEGVRITNTRNWYGNDVVPPTPAETAAMRAEAIEVARAADVVLLVLGDNEETSREAWSTEHMGDRDSLDLVGEQEALAEAVFALGKPVIVLLLNGRPSSIPTIADKAAAIFEGWYLGQEAGLVVADALFGRINPGGKLPISIPRSVGQLPSYYAVKPSARRGYLFDTTAPLYAFGHGLSYTSFALSAPRLAAPSIAPGQDVDVIVDVTNTGHRAGDEVVQVYVHPEVSSVTMPIRALKAFRRVTLQPGETRSVRLTLAADAFAIWNLDMRRVVEPGTFVIEAGPHQGALKATTLSIATA